MGVERGCKLGDGVQEGGDVPGYLLACVPHEFLPHICFVDFIPNISPVIALR